MTCTLEVIILTEQEFVSLVGPLAHEDMLQSGILASVTAAQACLESGYGTTVLATEAQNFFGMKTTLSNNDWASVWDGVSKYTKVTNEQKPNGIVYQVTADFRKYPDMLTSIRDHSCYLNGAKKGSVLRYAGLSGEKNYRKAAQLIKDGGYATDIAYVDKLCSLIERWNLTQYDKLEDDSMVINRDYITQTNTYVGKNNPKYIVIHETDNWAVGANGRKHAQAQAAGNLGTSVHYYSGSDGVYQAANHSDGTWSVGNEYGGNHSIHDASNYNTINIEICVNEDGDYNIARQNAIKLTRYLIETTGIPADRVIRHFDAKGKYCPRNMMDNSYLWEDFKAQVSSPEPKPIEWKGTGIKVCTENNVGVYRTSSGAASDRVGTLQAGDLVEVDGTKEGGFAHIALPAIGLYGYADAAKLVDYVPWKGTGIVIADSDNLEILIQPSGTKVGVVQAGSMLETNGETKDGWTHVALPAAGTYGWVPSNRIYKWKATGIKKAAANDVCVRATPEGRYIGALDKGGMVEVDGTVKTVNGKKWYRIAMPAIKLYGYMKDNLTD